MFPGKIYLRYVDACCFTLPDNAQGVQGVKDELLVRLALQSIETTIDLGLNSFVVNITTLMVQSLLVLS